MSSVSAMRPSVEFSSGTTPKSTCLRSLPRTRPRCRRRGCTRRLAEPLERGEVAVAVLRPEERDLLHLLQRPRPADEFAEDRPERDFRRAAPCWPRGRSRALPPRGRPRRPRRPARTSPCRSGRRSPARLLSELQDLQVELVDLRRAGAFRFGGGLVGGVGPDRSCDMAWNRRREGGKLCGMYRCGGLASTNRSQRAIRVTDFVVATAEIRLGAIPLLAGVAANRSKRQFESRTSCGECSDCRDSITSNVFQRHCSCIRCIAHGSSSLHADCSRTQQATNPCWSDRPIRERHDSSRH